MELHKRSAWAKNKYDGELVEPWYPTRLLLIYALAWGIQHNFCLTCSLLASIKHTISTTIWFWLKYIQNNHGSGRFILPAARKWENTNLTKLFMGTFPHQQMVDDAEKLNNNRTINQITSNLYILVKTYFTATFEWWLYIQTTGQYGW